MTATYDVSALATSAKDRIRMMIGDTDVGASGTTVRNPLIQDEEIAVEVARAGGTSGAGSSDTLAAVRACRRILARVSRDVDTSGAGIVASRSQRFQQIADTLEMLEREGFSQARVVLTGASISAKRALREDSDFEQPPFDLGMDDNP